MNEYLFTSKLRLECYRRDQDQNDESVRKVGPNQQMLAATECQMVRVCYS